MVIGIDLNGMALRMYSQAVHKISLEAKSGVRVNPLKLPAYGPGLSNHLADRASFKTKQALGLLVILPR